MNTLSKSLYIYILLLRQNKTSFTSTRNLDLTQFNSLIYFQALYENCNAVIPEITAKLQYLKPIAGMER